MLLAALAQGTSRLDHVLDADDTQRMRRCLAQCGIPVHGPMDHIDVEGGGLRHPGDILHVGASGTTLRFLLPVLAVHLRTPIHITGDPRLFQRPLAPLVAALAPWGVRWDATHQGGCLTPMRKTPDRLDIDVDVSLSSQFLTGLAITAASLPGGGQLRWQTAPPSLSYLELTEHSLLQFGCNSTRGAHTWTIPGSCLSPQTLTVSGDWSGAAAFLCAGAVTGRTIHLSPLDVEEPQGDKALLQILETAGCSYARSGMDITLSGTLQRGIHADLSLCPDLGPVLAAAAALAPAPSILSGLQTLPHKECDRLDASAELVQWLGGHARLEGDHTLHITPTQGVSDRPPFDPRNDHRMAFAAAVGGLTTGGTIINPGCVGKTLPTFWALWEAMLMG